MTKKEIGDHSRFLQDFSFWVARAATVRRDERPAAIAELVKFAYSTGYTHCTKHDAEDNKMAPCRRKRDERDGKVRVDVKLDAGP